MKKFARVAVLVPSLLLLNLGATACSDACDEGFTEVPANDLTSREAYCASDSGYGYGQIDPDF